MSNVETWDAAYAAYDDAIESAYGDTVNVAGYEYGTARALRVLDPIAYRTGFNDWADSEGIDTDELTGVDRDGE